MKQFVNNIRNNEEKNRGNILNNTNYSRHPWIIKPCKLSVSLTSLKLHSRYHLTTVSTGIVNYHVKEES